MGVRTIGLGLAAVVVLGGGLYLFLQVTSDPGAPAVAARDDRPAPRDQPVPPSAGSAIRFSPTTPRTGSATIKKPITPTGDTTPATTTATPPALDTDDPGTNPDVDLDTAMDEANKLYDVNDYEAASKQALRVLAKHPDNIRMLRIVVSSGCYMGDLDQANKYNAQLPAHDQADMVRRCNAAQVKLDPPPPATATGIRKP